MPRSLRILGVVRITPPEFVSNAKRTVHIGPRGAELEITVPRR